MDQYRIKPGTKVRLDKIDPDDASGFKGNKDEGTAALGKLNTKLEELQDLLFAEGKHRVLVVLQGMDTAGKDGTIRWVFNAMDPLGLRVASFKIPSSEERAHDYLWRIHKQVPGDGELVIFNRSHYEDVLVVRVHDIVPKKVWSRRYDQINAFEKHLSETGTTIVKFFLHISKDEQKQRLQERLDRTDKQWKFNLGDLDERKLWNDYQEAYEDALSKTSTEWAPWHVIPANRKWYRNLAISKILIDTLKGLKMKYPEPQNLEGVVVE